MSGGGSARTDLRAPWRQRSAGLFSSLSLGYCFGLAVLYGIRCPGPWGCPWAGRGQRSLELLCEGLGGCGHGKPALGTGAELTRSARGRPHTHIHGDRVNGMLGSLLRTDVRVFGGRGVWDVPAAPVSWAAVRTEVRFGDTRVMGGWSRVSAEGCGAVTCWRPAAVRGSLAAGRASTPPVQCASAAQGACRPCLP